MVFFSCLSSTDDGLTCLSFPFPAPETDNAYPKLTSDGRLKALHHRLGDLQMSYNHHSQRSARTQTGHPINLWVTERAAINMLLDEHRLFSRIHKIELCSPCQASWLPTGVTVSQGALYLDIGFEECSSLDCRYAAAAFSTFSYTLCTYDFFLLPFFPKPSSCVEIVKHELRRMVTRHRLSVRICRDCLFSVLCAHPAGEYEPCSR